MATCAILAAAGARGVVVDATFTLARTAKGCQVRWPRGARPAMAGLTPSPLGDRAARALAGASALQYAALRRGSSTPPCARWRRRPWRGVSLLCCPRRRQRLPATATASAAEGHRGRATEWGIGRLGRWGLDGGEERRQTAAITHRRRRTRCTEVASRRQAAATVAGRCANCAQGRRKVHGDGAEGGSGCSGGIAR